MDVAPSDAAKTEAAQRILATAERLFGERGFNGVSMQHIADEAGVSKANVFHHFSSKLTLYEAVLGGASDRFERLQQLLAADGRDLADLLHDFDRQHLRTMLEQDGSAMLFIRQLLESGAGVERNLVENVIAQNFDRVVATFDRLKREGKLGAHVDPAVLALTIVGSHIAFFLLRGVLPAAADPEQFSQRMIDHLIAGIRPNAGADVPPPGEQDV